MILIIMLRLVLLWWGDCMQDAAALEDEELADHLPKTHAHTAQLVVS